MVELRYRSTLHKANEKCSQSQMVMRYDGYAYKALLPHFLGLLKDPEFKVKLRRMGDFVELRIINSADLRGLTLDFKGEEERMHSESEDERDDAKDDRKRKRNKPLAKDLDEIECA